MCWRLRAAGVLLWFALPLSSPRAPAWAALVAGPEFQVNTFTTGSQRRPAVAADAAGNFVVVWVSQDQDGSGDGVFARRYDSTGIPVGPEFRVNTYTTGYQGDPAAAADAAGNFLVVWSSDQYGRFQKSVFGQRYDKTGEPQGPEFRVNTYTTILSREPRVAVDAAGRFVVVWESYGQDGDANGVFGRRFHASGTPLGPEFQVNTYTTDDQLAPAVAADAGGNFVVVWTSYSNTGPVFRSEVDGRRFDPSGTPRGPEFPGSYSGDPRT